MSNKTILRCRSEIFRFLMSIWIILPHVVKWPNLKVAFCLQNSSLLKYRSVISKKRHVLLFSPQVHALISTLGVCWTFNCHRPSSSYRIWGKDWKGRPLVTSFLMKNNREMLCEWFCRLITIILLKFQGLGMQFIDLTSNVNNFCFRDSKWLLIRGGKLTIQIRCIKLKYFDY